ncbi:DUF1707 and FHA domain-containing protein [Kitasatospora sp. NPDC085879]|uniref:DUF1707 and FHA domain-containing protein n=1 Tax=Kitasatospora sp. NPDC085879 TaxID=3154769 RepID=UPI003442BF65
MASAEFGAEVARPSEADRERALGALRDGVGNGRLSHDTFMRRMELVLVARTRAEIDEALSGLPNGGPVGRLVLRAVGGVSAFHVRLRRTWHNQQLPELGLPQPGPAPLRIGRNHGSGLRLSDSTVSRTHAELRYQDGGWVLHDLGSANGTFVNGRRVTGPVRVGPGDQVGFGRASFRLTGNR